MNKSLGFVLFTAGAVIGSAVTWQVLKTKYEKIAQEEIESIREMYLEKISQPDEDITEEKKEEVVKFFEEEKDNYKKIAEQYNNGDFDDTPEPYIISPQEFGEEEDFNQVSLTLYFDNVLADENGEIISSCIIGGEDMLNFMGEYAEDALHIRNEHLRSDYEIIYDDREYLEAYPDKK